MDTSPTNAHEYSVSELAFSLKRTVEETYGRVRVRGELGRVVIAKSGHMYVDVKDDKAVIASIMWKGSVSRLSVRPEEGMEVVVEGKLSTYPGRSQYQLVIDKLEPAGVGALMALLEKRKKQLASEGLFDERPQSCIALPSQNHRRDYVSNGRGDPRYFTPHFRPLPRAGFGLASACARR